MLVGCARQDIVLRDGTSRDSFQKRIVIGAKMPIEVRHPMPWRGAQHIRKSTVWQICGKRIVKISVGFMELVSKNTKPFLQSKAECALFAGSQKSWLTLNQKDCAGWRSITVITRARCAGFYVHGAIMRLVVSMTTRRFFNVRMVTSLNARSPMVDAA